MLCPAFSDADINNNPEELIGPTGTSTKPDPETFKRVSPDMSETLKTSCIKSSVTENNWP